MTHTEDHCYLIIVQSFRWASPPRNFFALPSNRQTACPHTSAGVPDMTQPAEWLYAKAVALRSMPTLATNPTHRRIHHFRMAASGG